MNLVLWAVISEPISQDQAVAVAATVPSQSTVIEVVERSPQESVVALALNKEKYLDSEKRYLYAPGDGDKKSKASTSSTHHWFATKVVDCQPEQKPTLENRLDQIEAQLQEPVVDKACLREAGLPIMAFPYLSLAEFAPSLPEIYDAWCDGDRETILLFDRSGYQMLQELWASEELPKLQILYYFDEMTKLWQALGSVNCCQSLLIADNLRVDEDQALVLQQLYGDPPDSGSNLTDLVQMWRSLVAQSDQNESTWLEPVFEQIEAGNITTIEQLRSQLHDLAEEQSSEPVESAHQTAPLTAEFSDFGFQSYSEFNDADEMPTVMLPTELRSLHSAGLTDIGEQRQQNEDFYGIEEQINKKEISGGQKVRARGLYLVCDGMGGHERGEVASAMAVETLQQYFQQHWLEQLPDEETIKAGILLANQTIYRANLENASSGNGRMGTTLVMVLVQDTRVAIAHVGDSRIYCTTRKEAAEQLTLDHAVGQREIRRGVEPEIAYARPDAHQLTQALGPYDNRCVQPEIEFLELREDTLLLLCSDGLCDGNFISIYGQEYLTPLLSSKANLDQGLHQLVNLANQHNGHDNITAIAVRIKVQPSLEQDSAFLKS